MTQEEAIKIIKECKEKGFKHTFYTVNEYDTALNMAIKALEQEPCEDAISRQAVLDLIADYDLSMGQVVKGVHALPPAQPEIIRCRQCKYAEVADSEDSHDGYICQFHRGSIWFSGSYCSWAERRQDE